MFRRGTINDPVLRVVYNVSQEYEALQVKELLEKHSIPCVIMDREDSGSYLRVLGYGSPFGLDIYVHVDQAEKAAGILRDVFGDSEIPSEEELEKLAMEAEDPSEG